MPRRRRIAQNPAVARRMNAFFRYISRNRLTDPADVARSYGRFLLDGAGEELVNGKKISRSRFYVGLSVGENEFDSITKRVALISDTLLLSHDRRGALQFLRTNQDSVDIKATSDLLMPTPDPMISPMMLEGGFEAHEANRTIRHIGMHCPNLSRLGKWIIDSEPLLRSGLVWYLPSYSETKRTTEHGQALPPSLPKPMTVIDYLIEDGRAIDVSGAAPIKSRLVRPIVRIDLPFVEGISLCEFSRITVGEFDSYRDFRNFLRRNLLRIDEAINDDRMDRELTLIGLEIEDQIRSVSAEMKKVHKKRAVAVTGAGIATTTAVLVAVHAPSLQNVLTILGAGGLWGIMQAKADSGTRSQSEDKWHYVWALARQANLI